MDGFKRRLNGSIQLKLSVSLSLAIAVVALLAGVFSFVSAFDEAHELQDDTLRQVAALFDRQQLPIAALGSDGRTNDGDDDSRVTVQLLVDGHQTAAPGDAKPPLPLPNTLSDGLHTLNVVGEQYRVLVRTKPTGERIAVAQETGVRDEIARDSALRTLMPFLILMPILLLLVADLVRKMFRPIAVLAAEIDQRAEQDLRPVENEHLPVEVRPFIVAINRLLERVAKSMEGQRRFVADAAHELRSPLTAMSLQAERLADADMSALARERLATLRKGIERGRNLLDQLLTLAKVQAMPDLPNSPISVQAIYRRVLEDLLPLAQAKGIDIGVVGDQDAEVLVGELALTMVLKNLIDNAIRYTPDGGRVDLSLTRKDGLALLQIRDTGPGIPAGERGRVFDPFYRTLGSNEAGSGLGLSIVKTIADRVGAEIRLTDADETTPPGLCVSVLIPIAKRPGGD